jgi:hypothetical protein
MSKKTRRQLRQETPAKSSTTVNQTQNRPSFTGRGAEFNPDYAPIIKDLRRIAILAGSFIIILVALSFFLR